MNYIKYLFVSVVIYSLLSCDSSFKKDKLIKEFFENGNLKSQVCYRNRLKHGLYTEFFINGEKKYECLFIEGLQDSIVSEYHENGKIKMTNEWHKGRYSGEHKRYSSDGILISHITETKEGVIIHEPKNFMEQEIEIPLPEAIIIHNNINDLTTSYVYENQNSNLITDSNILVSLHTTNVPPWFIEYKSEDAQISIGITSELKMDRETDFMVEQYYYIKAKKGKGKVLITPYLRRPYNLKLNPIILDIK